MSDWNGGGGQEEFDPFATLSILPRSSAAGTNPTTKEPEADGEGRGVRNDLLDLDESKGPEHDSSCNEDNEDEEEEVEEEGNSSENSSENSSDDGEERAAEEKSFGFPVTKNIFTFLDRLSIKSIDSGGNSNEEENEQEGEEEEERVERERKEEQESKTNHSNKTSYSKLISNLRNPQAAEILASIKIFVGKFLAQHKKIISKEEEEEEEDIIVESGSKNEKQNQTEKEKKNGCINENEKAIGKKVSWDGDTMPGENNKEAKKVQEFLRRTEHAMKNHPLWNQYSNEEWDKTVEALEKFIMCKIEKAAFQPRRRDKQMDFALKRKIQTLSFLRPEHLEVSRSGETFLSRWKQAGNELQNMNRFRSPRDKVVCIMNCCRLITNLLRDNQNDDNETMRKPQVGADDFVPALIYCVLKSNPDNLHSNLDYVASYRNPNQLRQEVGYFITQMCMAVSFIQGLDYETLTISKQVYEKGMAICEERVQVDPGFTFGWKGAELDILAIDDDDDDEKEQEQQQQQQQQQQKANHECENENVENQSWNKQKAFQFEHIKDANQLQIGQVQDLLNEYHELLRLVKEKQVK